MTRAALKRMAVSAATRNGLPARWFVAQIGNAENERWDPRAVSHKGALGIAQIMPSTARGWGVDPLDAPAALDAAAKAMASYWRTYQRQGHPPDEAYRRALAAYIAGPGAVAKYNGVPPYPEAKAYIAKIMGG